MRSLALVWLVAACGGSLEQNGSGGGSASDFPDQPIFDPAAGQTAPPADAPDLFGEPGSGDAGGGPCLVETVPGSLIPRNWLRPRFRWIPAGRQNLFELRLRAENQQNELVVYTTATRWTMPADMWRGLAAHSVDGPIHVTIRGAEWNGSGLEGPPALGSEGDLSIAPADADGSIVYWTSSGGTALRGFHVGAESVVDVLRPAQAGTQCIGCHASTPDGEYVGFSASDDPANGGPARIALAAANGSASAALLSPAAASLAARTYQQMPVFSPAHWRAGDRVALTTLRLEDRWEIIWTDLDATSPDEGQGWGRIARDGDGGQPSGVTLSHDGLTVVYGSASETNGGVSPIEGGDLYAVPYGDRRGGSATVLAGAAEPDLVEYYPTFAPDDRLLAFNRIPAGMSGYDNPQAEVFVLPAAGGEPLRVAANDPPVCSGVTSPGITNSWPKWAPTVSAAGERAFYWLTFSSRREASGIPQLYVAPLVMREDGRLETFPALYLWNQPDGEANHTPAWDVFQIVE